MSTPPWRAVEETLGNLSDSGLLERTGNLVHLTTRGRLLADSVGAEIMAAFVVEEAVL